MGRLSRLGLGIVAVAALAGTAHGQPYPQRVITVVAATAAGGPGDTAARLIGERMSPILGQQLIIENVPGAGGTMAAARVAKAEPDGYTVLVQQTGITIAPAYASNLPYNLEKDLAVVGLVNTSYSFLVGRKDLPANDLKELLAWMKGPGRPARVAHPGIGSMGQLSTTLFGKFAATDINPIAYRGIGPAMNDVLGGHVDLVWAGAVNSAPQIQAGAIKAYAFGGKERSKLVPSIPTVIELDAPELSIPFWHAMFAPAGTPKPIIDTLNAALREALAHPQLLKAYADSGVEVFPKEMLTPEGASTFVYGELERWSTFAKLNPEKEK